MNDSNERDHDARLDPDLVKRNFVAASSNYVWVADITYIPAWAGFLCWQREAIALITPRHMRELFATLEGELINRRSFKSQVEARMAIFDFIAGWHNPHRRHSAINYWSSIDFERNYQERLTNSPKPPGETGRRQYNRWMRLWFTLEPARRINR